MSRIILTAHTPAERDAADGIADWDMSITDTPEVSNVVA
jgi:hypothetical protein